MRELLTTGRQVKLRERRSQRRKTRYDLSLVNYNGRWVSVDARLPGILFVESTRRIWQTETE
jgi:DNA-binding sugar fermentation-stimulating protein